MDWDKFKTKKINDVILRQKIEKGGMWMTNILAFELIINLNECRKCKLNAVMIISNFNCVERRRSRTKEETCKLPTAVKSFGW